MRKLSFRTCVILAMVTALCFSFVCSAGAHRNERTPKAVKTARTVMPILTAEQFWEGFWHAKETVPSPAPQPTPAPAHGKIIHKA